MKYWNVQWLSDRPGSRWVNWTSYTYPSAEAAWEASGTVLCCYPRARVRVAKVQILEIREERP